MCVCVHRHLQYICYPFKVRFEAYWWGGEIEWAAPSITAGSQFAGRSASICPAASAQRFSSSALSEKIFILRKVVLIKLTLQPIPLPHNENTAKSLSRKLFKMRVALGTGRHLLSVCNTDFYFFFFHHFCSVTKYKWISMYASNESRLFL